MTQWVSFQELKEQVSMADVLTHYGLIDKLRPQKGGDELVGLCPLHQETKSSFHASLSKNVFHCFGCKKKGNILDFVAFKEGVDIREAGLLVQEWFRISSQEAPESPESVEKAQGGSLVPPEQENPPLTFSLKNLDPKHPYLKERGLKKETIEHFGLGFCSRGVMKGRVAIPIYNEHSELIAYAGRWPGEPPEGAEKYMLPGGFMKSQVVFNLHQSIELAKDRGLILVEGYFDCLRVWQAGFPQVVALMGSYLSPRQKGLLAASLGPNGKLTLLFDADEAGRNCQAQCIEELSGEFFIKVVRLPEEGSQPDQLSDKQTSQILAG